MKYAILLALAFASVAHAESADDAFYDGMATQQRNDWIDQQYQTQMRDERRSQADYQRTVQRQADEWRSQDQVK